MIILARHFLMLVACKHFRFLINLQSGSLYTDWGWFNSKNQLFEITESIRNQHNCSKDESVYKCLENKGIDELLSTVVTDNPLVYHWHPVPDDDFFPGYASQEVYNATKR